MFGNEVADGTVGDDASTGSWTLRDTARNGKSVARSRYHWACLYGKRGASHDDDRRNVLAEKSAVGAHALGMRSLARNAEKLLGN